MDKISRELNKIEFILGFLIAILLSASLLFRRYFLSSYRIISFLIIAFVVIRILFIIKRKGTVFEDYISLAIFFSLGIIDLLYWQKLNSAIVVVMIFILIYSIGLIPWVDYLIKSRKVIFFVFSYAFFVILIILLFAGLYFSNNSEFLFTGKRAKLTFGESFYFSTISFATVGYGDISPLGINRTIAVIEAFASMILNIAFIGHVLASRRFLR